MKPIIMNMSKSSLIVPHTQNCVSLELVPYNIDYRYNSTLYNYVLEVVVGLSTNLKNIESIIYGMAHRIDAPENELAWINATLVNTPESVLIKQQVMDYLNNHTDQVKGLL